MVLMFPIQTLMNGQLKIMLLFMDILGNFLTFSNYEVASYQRGFGTSLVTAQRFNDVLRPV